MTRYQILRRRPEACEGSFRIHVANTNSTKTEYLDTDVEGGVRYVYRVKAINSEGAGQRSNYVSVRRARSTDIWMLTKGRTPTVAPKGRDLFDVTLHNLEKDEDGSTVDYVLRGDAYLIADDGTTSDADICEGDSLGKDIDITIVDEDVETFGMKFGGAKCVPGAYNVVMGLTDGEGGHLLTMELGYTMQ